MGCTGICLIKTKTRNKKTRNKKTRNKRRRNKRRRNKRRRNKKQEIKEQEIKKQEIKEQNLDCPENSKFKNTSSSLEDNREVKLGEFNDEFTLSAMVLAAQGKVNQISIDEIDWLSKLRRGLEETRKGFVTELLDKLGDDPLTSESLDDLETLLLRADVRLILQIELFLLLEVN